MSWLFLVFLFFSFSIIYPMRPIWGTKEVSLILWLPLGDLRGLEQIVQKNVLTFEEKWDQEIEKSMIYKYKELKGSY